MLKTSVSWSLKFDRAEPGGSMTGVLSVRFKEIYHLYCPFNQTQATLKNEIRA